jgi:ABC-2 type transport system permease protein
VRSSAEPVFRPWIAFWTLLRREVMRYLKLAVQTIGAPFLSNVLLLTVFGGQMASRPTGIAGVSYLRFLVPGVVLMGVLLSSFQGPLFSLVAMKYQNTLQDLSQYPLSSRSRFLAFSLAGALRGLLVGAATYAAAGLFGGFALAHPAAFWAYAGAVSFVGAAGGIAAGLHLDSFEKANFVISIVLTPALFLGGVFFDREGTVVWVASIARYNPFTFVVGQGRRLFLGAGAMDAPVTVVLAGLVCVGAIALGVEAVARGRGSKIA